VPRLQNRGLQVPVLPALLVDSCGFLAYACTRAFCLESLAAGPLRATNGVGAGGLDVKGCLLGRRLRAAPNHDDCDRSQQ
jgi:hypothetical protein